MSFKETLEQISNIADQVVIPLGLSLVDTRFSQNGKMRTLEVTIHRPGSAVCMEDCEKVSQQLNHLLDHQSPPLIEGAFLLEVQSPGIDRQLKTPREFAVFAGCPVDIKSKEHLSGLGYAFTGVLVAVNNGLVKISKPQPVLVKNKKKNQLKSSIEAANAVPDELEIELVKLTDIRLYATTDRKQSHQAYDAVS